jgi:hypothetical protein
LQRLAVGGGEGDLARAADAEPDDAHQQQARRHLDRLADGRVHAQRERRRLVEVGAELQVRVRVADRFLLQLAADRPVDLLALRLLLPGRREALLERPPPVISNSLNEDVTCTVKSRASPAATVPRLTSGGVTTIGAW